MANQTTMDNESQASLWRRLLGIIVDGTLLFAICYSVTLPVNLIVPFKTTSTQILFTVIIVVISGGLLFLTRNLIFGGTSIGHFVTGTRIVNNDGSSPSIKQYILRELPLLFWPLEIIGVIANGFEKRYGDSWTGTQVTIDPKMNAWARTVLGLVLVVGGYYASTAVMGITMSTYPPYEKATKTLKDHPEVKAVTGEVKSFGWFPSGSVNINSERGMAVYQIKINGEKSTRWVDVLLVNKTGNNWTVQRISVE
jgi:uncharacterized RDD family membrane protein YckC